ncbi:hypothetical protein [uncultured Psychroserpens sp.]|uniref:hypothetical protein n=1 Tax=uncultured Psychroserpens sp. TaxID=255436 RepID=UPI002639F953|nr:hypothetical protein [uncultured Psychroserpens sp.]
MKVVFVFLISCFSLLAQDQVQFHYTNLVESYYDKTNAKPIFIYNAKNGKIVDTLSNVEDKNSWYKIAILDSEYGWFKIKNIQRLPSSFKDFDYEDHWVKTQGFLIAVDNYDVNHHVYLYDEPTKYSNKIHKVDNFQLVAVAETTDLWAKVSFMVGKEKVEGWLSFEDQCAYPWTTCPK